MGFCLAITGATSYMKYFDEVNYVGTYVCSLFLCTSLNKIKKIADKFNAADLSV